MIANPTLEEQNDTAYLNSPEVVAKFKAITSAISELDGISYRGINGENVDKETEELCVRLKDLYLDALKATDEKQGVLDTNILLECIPPERMLQAVMQYFTYRLGPVFNFLNQKEFVDKMAAKRAEAQKLAKLVKEAPTSKTSLN